jgi:hypothetical protein
MFNLKAAEEEKASLITSIRLLYTDLKVSQPTNDNYAEETNQPSHQPMEKQVNPNDTDNCQQAKVMYSIPLQNKYSPLNVEEAGESGPESTANAESQSTGKCVKAEIVVIGDSIISNSLIIHEQISE